MILRFFMAVVLTVFMTVFAPVLAQQTNGIDYDRWNRIAEQAETIVEDGTANDVRLEELRANMVEWRDQFTAGQNVNATRIAAVREQIEALGPAPAEGATEDADIAARRKVLEAEMSALQAPRLAAIEGYSRADSIVRSIDALVRDRQTGELLRVTPSPLNPANWIKAASEGAALVNGITGETGQKGAERGGLNELRQNLPTVAAYLIAALVLLTYGRIWIDSLPRRLSERASIHSRAVLAFVVSLGQIAIPLIGIYLAISALDATGLFGRWTGPFLNALPSAGLLLFGGRWLAVQVFPRQSIAYDTISVPADKRNSLRLLLTALSAVLAVHYVLAEALLPLSGFVDARSAGDRVPMDFDEGAAGVWHFLLIVPASFLLFRLGNILRRLPRWAGTDSPSFRVRILAGCGAISRVIALLAPLMALIGMVSAANALIWPWTITIGLIFLLILLQDFTADLFQMFTRGQEGAREGLGPVLIGFALILLSAPLFALIWGARPADIAEAWTRIGQGVSLGGVRLSPGGVLTFIVVFAFGYSVTRFLQGAFRSTILPKTRIDPGGQNALVAGLGYIGIFLASVLAITSAGIDLSSLAIVAGALSVGIGFGMQNIVSNFVSGIILLIERPISVGDWISAGGQQGIVKRISVRSTEVETFDKTEVIVPNSDLVTQPVVNWTRGNKSGRIIIPVGVAYGSDTRKVTEILRQIIEDQPLVSIDPAPAVLLRTLATDSLNFEIRAILADASSGLSVTSEVLHQVVARFAEEGIEIPFAQRDIWLRNPDALPCGPQKPKADPKPKTDKPSSDTTKHPPAPPVDPRLDGVAPDPDGDDGDQNG